MPKNNDPVSIYNTQNIPNKDLATPQEYIIHFLLRHIVLLEDLIGRAQSLILRNEQSFIFSEDILEKAEQCAQEQPLNPKEEALLQGSLDNDHKKLEADIIDRGNLEVITAQCNNLCDLLRLRLISFNKNIVHEIKQSIQKDMLNKKSQESAGNNAKDKLIYKGSDESLNAGLTGEILAEAEKIKLLVKKVLEDADTLLEIYSKYKNILHRIENKENIEKEQLDTAIENSVEAYADTLVALDNVPQAEGMLEEYTPPLMGLYYLLLNTLLNKSDKSQDEKNMVHMEILLKASDKRELLEKNNKN